MIFITNNTESLCVAPGSTRFSTVLKVQTKLPVIKVEYICLVEHELSIRKDCDELGNIDLDQGTNISIKEISHHSEKEAIRPI
jgi:hypothetical protein